MASMPYVLNLDFPLDSLNKYFTDPDFETSSSQWSSHFIMSMDVETNVKSFKNNEFLEVKNCSQLPLRCYKHKYLTDKFAAKTMNYETYQQRPHRIDFRPMIVTNYLNSIFGKKELCLPE